MDADADGDSKIAEHEGLLRQTVGVGFPTVHFWGKMWGKTAPMYPQKSPQKFFDTPLAVS